MPSEDPAWVYCRSFDMFSTNTLRQHQSNLRTLYSYILRKHLIFWESTHGVTILSIWAQCSFCSFFPLSLTMHVQALIDWQNHSPLLNSYTLGSRHFHQAFFSFAEAWQSHHPCTECSVIMVVLWTDCPFSNNGQKYPSWTSRVTWQLWCECRPSF